MMSLSSAKYAERVRNWGGKCLLCDWREEYKHFFAIVRGLFYVLIINKYKNNKRVHAFPNRRFSSFKSSWKIWDNLRRFFNFIHQLFTRIKVYFAAFIICLVAIVQKYVSALKNDVIRSIFDDVTFKILLALSINDLLYCIVRKFKVHTNRTTYTRRGKDCCEFLSRKLHYDKSKLQKCFPCGRIVRLSLFINAS